MRRAIFILWLILCAMPACRRHAVAAIDWYDHVSQKATLAEAVRRGKPVMLLFETGWCPYCLQMREVVFRDPHVVELLRQFFAVRVDGDSDRANGLMQRYHVQGYPTIVFAQANGEPIGAWQDVPKPTAFAAHLREMLGTTKPHDSWDLHLHGKLETGEIPADEFYARATSLEERGHAEEAKSTFREGGLQMLRRVNGGASFGEMRSLLSPTIQLLLRGGALQEAEALARRAIAEFPNDYLYPYRLAMVLGEQGRLDEAVQQGARAFALSYGRNRVWVTEMLADLLVKAGDQDRAATLIREALAGVDWKTNPRKKSEEQRQRLEARLKTWERTTGKP
ncbi:MAG: thioredoxin family protein [Deltaproteobacteria bacterium]|nr:thioredoxin family protein [Deltaproteobacteria bacterium]